MSDTARPLSFDTAAVIGLGLIGGSIARDLAARGVRVMAYDRDTAAIDSARAEGVIDAALDVKLTGQRDAEVVIVAVPVASLRDVLSAVPSLRDARLITDVGSTKRTAVAAAESLNLGNRFVGSHPMAGDHRSGWTASRPGLFAGAKVYLCRTRETRDDAFAIARELWAALGACPEEIGADAHDRLVGHASHLPHAASTALATVLADAGISRDMLGPGGRDATRTAGGSVEMWSAIAADNADALLPAIDALTVRLLQLRSAIARGDEAAVRALFESARAWSTERG
jgi:prephenate dehydrogenase